MYISKKSKDNLFVFYVEDIQIKTNIPNLFKDIFLFFSPFFNVDTTAFFVKETISAILLENDDYSRIRGKLICNEQANVIYGGKKNERYFFFESYKCNVEGYMGFYFPKLSIFKLKGDLGETCIFADNPKNIFCFLRRLLRSEYLYSTYIRNGYMPLHAACVVKKNKALAFLGKSGAGKTSAILPLIEYFDYNLLASDLVFFTKEGIVIGTPEKMRISPITLKQYSPKYDYLIHSTEKLSFSPSFFSYVFKCKLVKEAMLDAIILPRINIVSTTNEMKKIYKINWEEYLSPFFYENKKVNNWEWKKDIYQLQYNGNVKKLIELYKINEVIE